MEIYAYVNEREKKACLRTYIRTHVRLYACTNRGKMFIRKYTYICMGIRTFLVYLRKK